MLKKILKILFCLSLCVFAIGAKHKKKKQTPITQEIPTIFGRIKQTSSRYTTFQTALELLEKRRLYTIVETGTARNGSKNCDGDGCSTLIWGEWAKKHGGIVYSVDIDPHSIEQSRGACTDFEDHISFIISDSIEFLHQFGKPIDFLYLDSFDFESSDPSPSQIHHLNEIIAAYPYLHQNSVVMIDDCGLSHGGKGKLVIEYLQNNGWTILINAYQVIMIQNSYSQTGIDQTR